MMKIGFDAKRYFFNSTGLGSHNRTQIDNLARFYPDMDYHLFTPRSPAGEVKPALKVHTPTNTLDRFFSSYWRSGKMAQGFDKIPLDIFHGLSNELPSNIKQAKCKSIVTIHDLINFRLPEHYPLFDRKVYARKLRQACNDADLIIAVSEQTKQDIIEILNISTDRIEVAYSACQSQFYTLNDTNAEAIKQKYKLPERYILYVGTINERKNLLGLLEAFRALEGKYDLKLVVAGEGKAYKKKALKYADKYMLGQKTHFLSSVANQDLPSIYRQAQMLVYPSIYEGLGLPIVEAALCKTPVVTSRRQAMMEAGGDHTQYAEPTDSNSIAECMENILTDESLRSEMIEKNYQHALNRFSPRQTTDRMMSLYQQLIR